MATPILKKRDKERLLEHMNLHMEHTALQYAAWAKYALKIELTQQDCAELFMEALHSKELSAT